MSEISNVYNKSAIINQACDGLQLEDGRLDGEKKFFGNYCEH